MLFLYRLQKKERGEGSGVEEIGNEKLELYSL